MDEETAREVKMLMARWKASEFRENKAKNEMEEEKLEQVSLGREATELLRKLIPVPQAPKTNP